MPSQKRKFGDFGEQKAEHFLMERGYKILEKNYRVKNLGEIDIIGEKRGGLFFFEVKTRNVKHETNFPIGFSIDEKKRRNLKRICQIYLSEKKIQFDKKWQVDAIFIRIDQKTEKETVEHIENILWEKYY